MDEDDDQRLFCFPNDNRVYEVPTNYNRRTINGYAQAQPVLPSQTLNIEQLMQSMDLNRNTSIDSASSSTSSSSWRNNNGSTIGQSTLPSWLTSYDDQSFSHLPSPFSDYTMFPQYDYPPYYPTQNPNPNPNPNPSPHYSLIHRRYRYGQAMASSSRQCRSPQDYLDDQKLILRPHQALFQGPRSKLRNNTVEQSSRVDYVKKLIELTEGDDLYEIVFSLRRQGLKEICTDAEGSRAMLKLVERLRCNIGVQMLLMRGLGYIAVELTSTINCKQLIDKCFEIFSHEANKLLLNEIANHCIEISKNQSGCCILQQCFWDPQICNRIVNSVTQEALKLSDDAFGNYIVQYVTELQIPGVATAIAAELKGNFVRLSMNQEGSNVVEKLIRSTSDPDVAFEIIAEMTQNPYQFLNVLQDQFGNFVAQTALKVSKSKKVMVYNSLKRFIVENAEYLKNHPHGRNVLRAIKDGKHVARRT